MKKFIFISLLITPLMAISTTGQNERGYLYPGYLLDGVSPAWSIEAYKWNVSINNKTSKEMFQPSLHMTCYAKIDKPDFCFSPDYDPNPGHYACIKTPYTGLSLWFSFDPHPDDPKSKYLYSPLGLIRSAIKPTFIKREVRVSAGNNKFFTANLIRAAVSTLENEDYNINMTHPKGRQWLYNFTHSSEKKLIVQGKNINIEAYFDHPALQKWLLETLEKCP